MTKSIGRSLPATTVVTARCSSKRAASPAGVGSVPDPGGGGMSCSVTPASRSCSPSWLIGQNGGAAAVSGHRAHAVTTPRSTARVVISWARRVFPIPGSPTTMAAEP